MKRISSEILDWQLEAIDDYCKNNKNRDGTNLPRSAAFRLALSLGLEQLGYQRTESMNSDEKVTTMHAKGIEDGQKMPSFIKTTR